MKKFNISTSEKLTILLKIKSCEEISANLKISRDALVAYLTGARTPRNEIKDKIDDYFSNKIKQI